MRCVKLGSCAVLLVVLAITLLHTKPSRTDPASVPAGAGKKINAFALKDTTGKTVALADFKDKKAVVVVFVGTECPINNAYMPRLAELHKEYAEKGVQFLALNSNRQDGPAEIAKHTQKHGIPFPVIDGEVASVSAQGRAHVVHDG